MEAATDTVRYNYRLRVKPGAELLLWREHYKALWIWNECVARSRRGEWFTDKDLTQHRRWHDWLWEGSVVVGQQVLRRFSAANGRRKFKSVKKELPSLNYTLRGFQIKDGQTQTPPQTRSSKSFPARKRKSRGKHKGKVGKHAPKQGKPQPLLCLANGITARIVMSREMPSKPKSVTVYQDSLGDWYASFVVQRAIVPASVATKGIDSTLGLDPGVSRIMTASDREYDLEHPEHGKKAAKKLATAQRKMARRKPKPGQKSSRGYKTAKKEAAKCHKKVARQRQDGHRKWAYGSCVAFESIALEDFKPKFLFKTTMARKAADAGIGSAKRELIFMARKFERNLVLIPPAYTSMTCSACDARTKHRLPLSQRVFECSECGLVMDRDENSANVMINRAGFNPAGVEEIRPRGIELTKATTAEASPNRHSEPGIP